MKSVCNLNGPISGFLPSRHSIVNTALKTHSYSLRSWPLTSTSAELCSNPYLQTARTTTGFHVPSKIMIFLHEENTAAVCQALPFQVYSNLMKLSASKNRHTKTLREVKKYAPTQQRCILRKIVKKKIEKKTNNNQGANQAISLQNPTLLPAT